LKILNLVQGSDEWHAARDEEDVCCASEAPVMMGESNFMSRNQLLDIKKGAAKEPITPFLQKLFDDGHRAEAAAREILELDHCEDFPAVTGIKTVEGIKMLASLDGLEGGVAGQSNWEHKLWNLTLVKNVQNNTLEPKYYYQLEHQMLVSGGNQTIFTCSDGTDEKKVSMIYSSVPERRKQLIAGWKSFLKDLETHEIKAKQEVVVAQKATMPVFTWEVSGTDISTNIATCLNQIKDLAETEMAKNLDSDQDFADKDQLNKDVKKARDALKLTLSNVEGKFVSFSEFAAVAKEMDSVLQKMQSAGEKQVKQAKDAKKKDIEDGGYDELTGYIRSLNEKIAPMYLANIVHGINPDLKSAMKGKRTIESLQAAVGTEINNVKLAVDDAMVRIVPNLAYLREHAAEYKFLFPDAEQLVNQSEESFGAVVGSRIGIHKRDEKNRLEAEAKKAAEAAREKIRKEEEQKARDKVAAEEKARRESEAKELAEKAAKETNERVADKIIEQIMEQEPSKETKAVIEDAATYGVGVSVGGKRVAPEDVHIEPVTFEDALGVWQERHNVSGQAIKELGLLINKYR